MTCVAGGARRLVAGGTAAMLLAAAALTQLAPGAHAQESPLPGVVLPVRAQDVTETDNDLGSAAREVVVVRDGQDGPEITKLRARTATDARRLATSLDRLPGVTAARNQVYRVPAADAVRSHDAEGTNRLTTPSTRVSADLRISDEQYGSDQWGLYAVGAEEAWTVTRGAGVTVAVIDTGVDRTHPDLVGRVLPQVDVAPGPRGDVTGHGTHVAGIIAASLNRTGVVGLANQASVLPIRIFDAQGLGDTATVARGVNVAVSRGVQVINLSLGGPGNDPVLARAIADAIAQGITVVASVGNDHDKGNATNYPANYPDVIGVGSVTYDFERSSFSNTGRYVDLVAPGEDIRSTYPDASWMWSSGTSMAAPFVSAAAALVRAANPTLSNAQVADVLFRTAWDDASGDGKDTSFGHGLVRADGATTRAARLPGGLTGPRISVRVAAKRVAYGDVLVVDVDPSKSDLRSYNVTIQRRNASGTWSSLPRAYRTQGKAETTSIRLPRGVYRVVVPAMPGYAPAVSAPVTLTAPTVQVRAVAVAKRSKLYVDVNPDQGERAWTFRVQKLTRDGRWATKKTYRTKGAAETRTINLKAGTYRVVVPGRYGLAGSASAAVTLVR